MNGTETIMLAVGLPILVSHIGLWISYSRAIGRMEGKLDGCRDAANNLTKRVEKLENHARRKR